MLALLPMLESVDTLIQWAQKRDAFVCDFVGALSMCQSNLFTMYLNMDTTFRKDEFHAYNQVLQCSHEQILMKWEANLNLPYESLWWVETLYTPCMMDPWSTGRDMQQLLQQSKMIAEVNF